MNRKQQLIAEVLGPGDDDAFARQAAALVRRRRAAKHTVAAGGIAAASVLALVLALRPAPTRVIPPAPLSPGVEIISDEELVAQLKDQPVLFLRDANRITGVVFLKNPVNGENP
jgi:hypothetical protein